MLPWSSAKSEEVGSPAHNSSSLADSLFKVMRPIQQQTRLSGISHSAKCTNLICCDIFPLFMTKVKFWGSNTEEYSTYLWQEQLARISGETKQTQSSYVLSTIRSLHKLIKTTWDLRTEHENSPVILGGIATQLGFIDTNQVLDYMSQLFPSVLASPPVIYHHGRKSHWAEHRQRRNRHYQTRGGL